MARLAVGRALLSPLLHLGGHYGRFIEHSYKEMKDELGLDHFEGRSWRGWQHHVTLVLLAYAFLVLRRRGRRKKRMPTA